MITKLFQLRFLAIYLFVISFMPEARSQPKLTKIKEWSTKEVGHVSVDRMGNFFLVYKKGGIKKYDPNGKVMASLSKKNPTLLEPWYHPSIFIYDRETQKYFSYGRFFEHVQEHKLAPEFAIEPYLVCPTHDNRLWILDRADYSLKKINPLNQEVINELTLNTASLTPTFSDLREYQNLIFLREKDAIWIINTLGKMITKIEGSNLGNFGFFGQELYYLQNNTIYFTNLLTQDHDEIVLEGDLKFALVTDERVITVSTKNKISLYNYVP
jgi:hypothetical protein